jgi:hypothetical protein
VRFPPEPELQAPQRGTYGLYFYDGGAQQEYRGSGWIRVDGPWIHVCDDDYGHWQSWPAHLVVNIEWVDDERRKETS